MIEPTMPVNPYGNNPYEKTMYGGIPDMPPPPPGMGKRKHRGVIIALVLLAILFLGGIGVYVIHAGGGQQVSHAQSKQGTKTVPIPTQTVPAQVVTVKEVLHDFQMHGLMVVGAHQESTVGWIHQPTDGAWGFNPSMGAGDYLQLATFSSHQDAVDAQQQQQNAAQDGPSVWSVTGKCTLEFSAGDPYIMINPYMDVLRQDC